MVVLTRQRMNEIFDHILTEVLGQAPGSAIRRAVTDYGCDEIGNLLTMSKEDLESLVVPAVGEDQAAVPLNRGSRNILRVFQLFVHYLRDTGDLASDIDTADWMVLTHSDFNAFRIGPSYVQYANYASSPQPPPRRQAFSSSSVSPADLFRRGVKKDPSLFPSRKKRVSNTI